MGYNYAATLGRVWTSTDGVTWALVASPSVWFNDVCWTGTYFVAVGGSTFVNTTCYGVIYTAPSTGTTWTSRLTLTSASTYQGYFSTVEYSSRLGTAVASLVAAPSSFTGTSVDISAATIYSYNSTTMTSWSRGNSMGNGRCNSIRWIPEFDSFFACISTPTGASTGSGQIRSSIDGITWTLVFSTASVIGIGDICYSAALGRLIAFGISTIVTNMVYSASISTSRMYFFPAVGVPTAMTTIFSSINGSTFITFAAPTSSTLPTYPAKILWLESFNCFLIVGYYSSISADGITWTRATLGSYIENALLVSSAKKVICVGNSLSRADINSGYGRFTVLESNYFALPGFSNDMPFTYLKTE